MCEEFDKNKHESSVNASTCLKIKSLILPSSVAASNTILEPLIKL